MTHGEDRQSAVVPSFSVDKLIGILNEQFGVGHQEQLALAFSGGGDSSALLHALVEAQAEVGFGLRALHVDHRLHTDSSNWATRAAEICRSLGVAFHTGQVNVDPGHAHGLEAAARDARYQWLCDELGQREILVLAHHADDQLETVLFRLLRGAGARGLRAIQPDSLRHGCRLIRPLLEFSRSQLEDWANQRGVDWLQDPANRDERFDRVYLRQQVIPALRKRWPGAPQQAVQSCHFVAQTVAVADDLAVIDLQASQVSKDWIDDIPVFRCSSLGALPAHRLDNAVRYWCGYFGAPPRRRFRSLTQLVQSTTARGEVRYGDVRFRRYRDELHTSVITVSAEPGNERSDWPLKWREAPSSLDLGVFCLEWQVCRGQGVSVRRLETVTNPILRIGGFEGATLYWHGHHRKPKQLFQSHAVPPWERRALPRLLSAAGEIIAYPGLCVSDRWAAGPAEAGVYFRLKRPHSLDLGERWAKSC